MDVTHFPNDSSICTTAESIVQKTTAGKFFDNQWLHWEVQQDPVFMKTSRQL